MKVLKFNDAIAVKAAGKVSKFHALDPIFIEPGFWVLPEDIVRKLIGKFPSLISKIQNQISLGNIVVLDLSDVGNPDVDKIRALKNETEEEADARIATRTIFWDYKTQDITL